MLWLLAARNLWSFWWHSLISITRQPGNSNVKSIGLNWWCSMQQNLADWQCFLYCLPSQVSYPSLSFLPLALTRSRCFHCHLNPCLSSIKHSCASHDVHAQQTKNPITVHHSKNRRQEKAAKILSTIDASILSSRPSRFSGNVTSSMNLLFADYIFWRICLGICPCLQIVLGQYPSSHQWCMGISL